MQSLLQYREGIESEHGSHTVLKTPNWAFIQRKETGSPPEPNQNGWDQQQKEKREVGIYVLRGRDSLVLRN